MSSLFPDHRPAVPAAAHDPDLVRLGAELPDRVFLGTSTWTFPGWAGLVYGHATEPDVLAHHGLPAYAAHPLFRTVGVDRAYWRPLDAETWAAFAAQVPDGFRFVVKAHEWLCWHRFPRTERYADLSGQDNPRFLDPLYATEVVLGPLLEGLGDKAGPVVVQLPPQGDIPGFPRRLDRFLAGVPEAATIAIEIRSPELLTAAYGRVLERHGAVHCLTVHPAMPDLRTQWATAGVGRGSMLVARWNLATDQRYEDARHAWSPFDRLQQEDELHRDQLARALAWAVERELPAFVVANNKAEGSAPWTVRRLAERLREICDGM